MKEEATRESGRVKFFSGEYGFVKPDNGGEDLFLHRNQAPGDELLPGTRVTYEVQENRNHPGKFRAVRVELLGAESS
jgi:cold shock CspA family protein